MWPLQLHFIHPSLSLSDPFMSICLWVSHACALRWVEHIKNKLFHENDHRRTCSDHLTEWAISLYAGGPWYVVNHFLWPHADLSGMCLRVCVCGGERKLCWAFSSVGSIRALERLTLGFQSVTSIAARTSHKHTHLYECTPEDVSGVTPLPLWVFWALNFKKYCLNTRIQLMFCHMHYILQCKFTCEYAHVHKCLHVIHTQKTPLKG